MRRAGWAGAVCALALLVVAGGVVQADEANDCTATGTQPPNCVPTSSSSSPAHTPTPTPTPTVLAVEAPSAALVPTMAPLSPEVAEVAGVTAVPTMLATEEATPTPTSPTLSPTPTAEAIPWQDVYPNGDMPDETPTPAPAPQQMPTGDSG